MKPGKFNVGSLVKHKHKHSDWIGMITRIESNGRYWILRCDTNVEIPANIYDKEFDVIS
jgi:hypothetical protein